jgi:hypothetical protein
LERHIVFEFELMNGQQRNNATDAGERLRKPSAKANSDRLLSRATLISAPSAQAKTLQHEC